MWFRRTYNPPPAAVVMPRRRHAPEPARQPWILRGWVDIPEHGFLARFTQPRPLTGIRRVTSWIEAWLSPDPVTAFAAREARLAPDVRDRINRRRGTDQF